MTFDQHGFVGASDALRQLGKGRSCLGADFGAIEIEQKVRADAKALLAPGGYHLDGFCNRLQRLGCDSGGATTTGWGAACATGGGGEVITAGAGGVGQTGDLTLGSALPPISTQ